MPFAGGGGSLVTGGNIVDGTVSDADIATNAAIAQAKMAGFVGNNADIISVETTAGQPHSLTTVANQQVIVFAKGSVTGTGNTHDMRLNYGGVEKDASTLDEDAGTDFPWALMYTEIPGAATADITVTSSDGTAVITDVKIIVIKLKVAA